MIYLMNFHPSPPSLFLHLALAPLLAQSADSTPLYQLVNQYQKENISNPNEKHKKLKSNKKKLLKKNE